MFVQSKSGKPVNTGRTLEIFAAVQNGLASFIYLTQADLDLHRSIEKDLSINSAQQCKNGERYLKRLEFELAKLEELMDQYDIHLKMREGVRSMAYAYSMSNGPERDSALSSVRSGYKECTETLCFLESRLEAMMGTFHLQMKGIQGFARLCPGDVFEITIKHGESQKWKTRGKILKSGEQSWDHSATIIKALIEDKLTIKAVEVRGLGKNITLGVKTCETKDLFSARPQLMTINLNSVGTLKLNLIITWNPLHTSTTDSIGPSGSTLSRTSSSSLLGSRSSLTLPSLFSPSSYSKAKLSATLPPPRITEIIDADYYIHRPLSSNPSSTSSSTSSPGSGGINQVHHGVDMNISSGHCGSSPHSQGTKPTSTSSGSRSSSLHLTATSGFGSASGSASSYCGSTSVPNSTLTSPETEIPPTSMQTSSNGQGNHHINYKDGCNYIDNNNDNIIYHNNNNNINNNNNNNNNLINGHKAVNCPSQYSTKPPKQSAIKCSPSINSMYLRQTTERLLKEMGKSSQEIIVEATVHQSSSSLATSATTPTTTTTTSSSNASLYSTNIDRKTGGKLASYSSNSLFSPTHRNPNHQSVHQRHVSSHSLANVYFNISDILLNLMSSLENIQGQCSEIHYLHQSVLELYRILRNISRLRGSIFCNNNNQYHSIDEGKCCSTTSWKYGKNSSSTSDVSLSVEDALECFDFLNSAVTDSDPESSPATSTMVTPKTRKYDGKSNNKQWNKHCSSSSNHHLNHYQQHNHATSSPSLVKSKYTSVSVAAGLNLSGEKCKTSSPALNQPASHFNNSPSPIHTSKSRGRLNKNYSTSTTALSPTSSSTATTNSTPSPIDSPHPLSSGSEQLDICLMAHLNYCQGLLQNLGSFNSPQMREIRLLGKLSCQGMVIHRLACLCSNLCDYFVASSRYLFRSSIADDVEQQQAEEEERQQQLKWLEAQYQSKQETELSMFWEDSRIRKLWDTVCYQNVSVDSEEIGSMLLCVTSGQFAQTLESYMRAFLTPLPSGSSSTTNSRHAKSPGNGVGTRGISNSSLSSSLLSLSSTSSPHQSQHHHYNHHPSSASPSSSISNISMYKKVAQLITNRIIDSPVFEDDYVVTIFQVALFFRTENSSLELLFKSYAEEISLLESLSVDNPVSL